MTASFVDNTSIIDLYADDSTVHESGYDVTMIESHLQSSIEKIDFWCKINKMTINPLKSKCMILGSNHRLKHSPDLTLFRKSFNRKCVESNCYGS